MKYAIDSTGETFRVSETNGVHHRAEEDRQQELDAFAKKLFGDTKVFTLMSLNKESVCFFTKTKLSASSQTVKLANELDRRPEIVGNQRDYLQSIYPDDNNVSDWYYLGVGAIEFERNIYDGEYIDARFCSPIPYVRFMNLLDTELKGRKATNIGLEISYPKVLLETAVTYTSAFDLGTKEKLERYKQDNGFDAKDKDSNKATICLSMITDYKDNSFPVYQQVKNCIKKTFKEAYNIRYKSNCVTAQLDNERQLALYVVSNEPPLVVVGGRTMGIERLKNLLTSPELFRNEQWFDDKVMPVLDEIGNQTQREHNQRGDI